MTTFLDLSLPILFFHHQRLYKAADTCQRRNAEIMSKKGGFQRLIADKLEQVDRKASRNNFPQM
jgi:hypothetical protein